MKVRRFGEVDPNPFVEGDRSRLALKGEKA